MHLRTQYISAASFLLSAAVVLYAYHLKKQFYPSVVYMTKSNAIMAVFYVQFFVLVMLLGRLMVALLFGHLRPSESEHLTERAWYAVTETCLAFTVFRDDFSPRFVAQFTQLLFLKCFHWLSEDRVDYMERSPIITVLFHVRMMVLIGLLSAIDSYYVSHAYFITLIKGASVQIVFGFEYAILLTVIFHISIKYILHSIDLRNVRPWENKASYLLYCELVIECCRVVLYSIFIAVMINLHTFPLFSIRPMYLAMKSMKKAISDVVLSRRAIRYMNTLYPNATPEELQQTDNVCIICREEMATGAKKLPCNHIFHVSCLRSWFQRQQTCPTCRLDILQASANMTPAADARRNAAAAAAAPNVPNVPNQGVVPPMVPNLAAAFPFLPPNFIQQRMPVPPTTSAATSPPSTSTDQPSTSSTAPAGAEGVAPSPGTSGARPPGLPPPPMPFPSPFMPLPFPLFLPFPSAPNFAGLSDEEVQRMEGMERVAVEARIQSLRNIQTLLEAAVVQLQQYTSIVTSVRPLPLVSGCTQTEPDQEQQQLHAKQEPSTEESQPSTSRDEEDKESAPQPPSAGAVASDTVRQRRLQYFQS